MVPMSAVLLADDANTKLAPTAQDAVWMLWHAMRIEGGQKDGLHVLLKDCKGLYFWNVF